MSRLTFFAFLVLAGVAIIAVSAEDEDDHPRFRRVTCDLLSIGGKISLGDSACAANCLSMGKAGGHCNNGICECRKTTFGDLWRDRFGG